MKTTLTNLTVNTGHTQEIPRDFVRTEISEILRPLCTKAIETGHLFRLPNTAIFVKVTANAKRALFSFSLAKSDKDEIHENHALQLPLAMSSLCWSEAVHKEQVDYTQMMLRDYRQFGVFTGFEVMPKKEHVPWVATILLDASIQVFHGDPSIGGIVATMEGCIGWTLIELGNKKAPIEG